MLVALPASTSAHTSAEGNQRFHLRTESINPGYKASKNPSAMPTRASKPEVIMQLNVEGLSFLHIREEEVTNRVIACGVKSYFYTDICSRRACWDKAIIRPTVTRGQLN